MAEHYFMSVDGKKDFLVFNGDEPLNDETINNEDIEFVEIKEIQEIKSMAWSSNCKWTFVIQQDCIYLINTYKDLAVRCKKKSSKFFEMFLNKKEV